MSQLFNGFNTLVGLLLTVTAFIMQAQINNACGSKPLRNSILGVLVIGMTMFWVAAMGLYSGVPMFAKKEMFAGFVGVLGIILIALGSVIVQKSKQLCKNDVLCKQTIAGGNNSNDDTPCEGAKLWGGLVVAAGCLMVLSAGAFGFLASGADVLVMQKAAQLKKQVAAAAKSSSA